MVNSNADALGILFPNSYDSLVPDLVGERLMASIPFASRYRLVDFILSSMVNCGIDNISVIVRKNYHSLMDHLGSGREWDLSRKNGGLNLFPPFAEKTVKIYNGRVEALASILDFLKEQKERYVVMADTNLAVNFDFKALINAHMESGADVTIAYQESELPKSFMEAQNIGTNFYYTLGIEDGHVTLTENEKEMIDNPKQKHAFHGLYRSLVHNMVVGVSEGYKKELELVGVGYRASNQGNIIELALGYTHNIFIQLPAEVKVETKSERNKNPLIILESCDKQLLGQVCSKIRSFRKPEPYKGKGIKFVGEVIRRKSGKSAGAK